MELLRELSRSIFVLFTVAILVGWNQLPTLSITSVLAAPKSSSKTAKPVVPKDASVAVVAEAPPAPDYILPPAEDGLVPVLNRIPTTQKVVFLGIDDGITRSPDAMRLLTESQVPVSLFLNAINVEPDVGYFKELQNNGAVIENHTTDHSELTTLGYEAQKEEICANADRFGLLFGRRPTLFRPPYGAYDQTTRQAAADCGMRALVTWSAKANGGSMQYQDGNTELKPGDIVLMHFRPEFAQDFQAYQDAVTAAGLQTVLLEDWLK